MIDLDELINQISSNCSRKYTLWQQEVEFQVHDSKKVITFRIYDVMDLDQEFSEKQNLEKHDAKQHCGSLHSRKLLNRIKSDFLISWRLRSVASKFLPHASIMFNWIQNSKP